MYSCLTNEELAAQLSGMNLTPLEHELLDRLIRSNEEVARLDTLVESLQQEQRAPHDPGR